jgi:hypothetical protein
MADASFERLLDDIRGDLIRAVTPPARCDGCLYWCPVETLTVVQLRVYRFRYCPGCERQRMHHPEEVQIQEGRAHV